MKRLTLLVVLAMFAAPVLAAQPGGFDSNKIFFGGGLSQNDFSGSDKGTGFQFFGGYEFGEMAKNFKLDVEVGYMTTGDMDLCVVFLGTSICASAEAKGLWATAVGRFALNREWEIVGRAGMDFGDDDGFMFGAGVGYNLNKTSAVRFELVERDTVSSLQLNFVYRP